MILPGPAVGAGLSPAEYTQRLDVLERDLSADAESLRVGAEYRQLAMATSSYDRAIKFLEKRAERPGAGSHAYLNLAFAYVDKVPVSGKIRQAFLGRDAIAALTQSIAREPTAIAYMVRGLINSYFDNLMFHRTGTAVADLEEARRLAGAHPGASYLPRIFVGLGDGYWRLKNRVKARDVWREGAAQFPDHAALRDRLASTDAVVGGLIAGTLDPDARVDTSLREMFPDLPLFTVTSARR